MFKHTIQIIVLVLHILLYTLDVEINHKLVQKPLSVEQMISVLFFSLSKGEVYCDINLRPTALCFSVKQNTLNSPSILFHGQTILGMLL